jgi:hypothetical protein
MPTPFTHLETSQRLLNDTQIPQHFRDRLNADRPAFFLGGVAADARVGSGAKREVTHFYDYSDPIHTSPWRVMVRQNPRLMQPQDLAHRVFVAAYVAHLSIDEVWSLRIVRPHFARREWGNRMERFFLLHIILTYMDERDRARVNTATAEALCDAQPADWLDFLPDDDLRQWRDLIYEQIKPGGESQTLQIFSERINSTPEAMREILNSDEMMHARLWQHIPKAFLAQVETACYRHARQQMLTYLRATQPVTA